MSFGSLEAYGVKLRPVMETDAELILHLRNLPEVRPWISATSPKLDLQSDWIRAQRKREGDFYFIISSHKWGDHGTISVYNTQSSEPEWGRFIVQSGRLSAATAVFLLLQFTFETLCLSKVMSWTLPANEKMIAFNRRIGTDERSVFRPYQTDAGLTDTNFVRHLIDQNRWKQIRQNLELVAKRFEATV